MFDNVLLGHDTELTPIPRTYRSSDRLIHTLSEEDSERALCRTSLEYEPRSKQQTFGRQSRGLFTGWKFTAFLAFMSSLLVFLFNTGFLIYSAAGTRNGNGMTLVKGDCNQVHHLGKAMHWLVNVLSTGVLSASNFGMQCLVAPTRKDVDRAHRTASWLDIGVPSLRNLFRISRKRSFLWLCLCFSSLPFHLFYNSAIYYKTAVPAYEVFAGPGSLHQMDWPDVQLNNIPKTSDQADSLKSLLHAAKNGTLHHLDSASCVAAFAQTYQTSYGKLLLATESAKDNDSYTLVYANPVYQPKYYPGNKAMLPYPWVCPSDSGSQRVCSENGSSAVHKWAENKNWTVDVQPGYMTSASYNIQHCLAEPVPQKCSLQYSPPSMVAVVVANLVKTGILLYIWLGMPRAPLLTVGDGIASFLRRSDPYSLGMCLPSDGSAIYTHPVYAKLPSLKNRKFRRPAVYTGKRRLWGSSVSTRWGIFILWWMLSIIAGLVMLMFGLNNAIGIHIWQTKPGEINSQTITSTGDSQGFVANSIMANLPQLIFSFLYVAYNSILTSMCLSAEWSRFGHRRKGLRVSHNPRLSQRSNYFLTLPYRYAVPLMATSAVLHWLVSQSLFVIAIEAYNTHMERDPLQDVYACGYSPLAIVIATSIGGVMFTCLIVLSLRRLESAMPVAGSCSLAIAAACHPGFNPNVDKPEPVEMESEDEGEDMALLPLQWGSISIDGPIGHCSFTSGDVDTPEKGQKYQ
ncbi:Pc14g01100 [Penicillium rubens Wisconsin 54-1255]|uniref:Pc14g01100 protein n=2 Tax=Penicillium chrysogenum species complex TaxID=254878 RepID=B6H5T8_PENRW|nr:hypothetical protein N7534_010724 [Penicillium rubens]CAP74251.1 Pc14g01100 [Penicillium rubens Wisconsin 54-1255]